MTKPSRSRSNGRDARAGSSLRVLSAFIAENPARPICDDRSFRAAREKNIGIAKFDDPPGFTDGIIRCRAGGDDTHVGSSQVELHRDDAAGHIADQHRNREWRSPRGPFRQQDRQLILKCF